MTGRTKKKKPNQDLLALIEKKKKALKAKKTRCCESESSKAQRKGVRNFEVERNHNGSKKKTIDKLREHNEGLQETIISLKGNLRGMVMCLLLHYCCIVSVLNRTLYKVVN